MSSILDGATSGGALLRVTDRDRTVEWFRQVLGIEPLIVASDGADHPFAAFVIAGLHFGVWQLPPGVERSRDENDRNTYLAFTHPDPKRVHAALQAVGADVGKASRVGTPHLLLVLRPRRQSIRDQFAAETGLRPVARRN